MDDAESAATARMRYEVNVADIREAKAREWSITYLVLLLFGAMVAADRLLPDSLDCFIFAAVLIAGVLAIIVLWGFLHCTIADRRIKLCELERELRIRTPEQLCSRTPWHDAWIPILLTVFIVMGIFAAAWIVLLPEPLPGL